MKTSGPNTFIKKISTRVGRRDFLKYGAAATGVAALSTAGAFGWSRFWQKPEIPGELKGAPAHIGHLLRGGLSLAVPSATREVDVVVVGGGISGLSAAWQMKRKGFENFVLLELDEQVGGNSASGQNRVTRYPWGAHYIPLPGPEALEVRALFEELGVIEAVNSEGVARYNEYYLCADPSERLQIHGTWYEGLSPRADLNAEEAREHDEFFQLVEELKVKRGQDGKRAFVIPIDQSSQDPAFLQWDQMTMAEFLNERKWKSERLRWYINYCCRDDYGATLENVSAWAGLHYFASRVGVGINAPAQTVLTWPEGNGWVVDQLRKRVAPFIQTNSLVYSITNDLDKVHVDYFDAVSRTTSRITAKKAIFAAPRFVAGRVVKEFRDARPAYLSQLSYAPWMVANITLKEPPRGAGAPLAWDNVSYESPSLGYVVATHQRLEMRPKRTVITYYRPLSSKTPVIERTEALKKSYGEWRAEVVADLSKIHFGIEPSIERLDVWVWGHGTFAPGVNFIWGDGRKLMKQAVGNIHFAHSDMSGVSIFEEAHHWGVTAANQILESVG